MSLVELKERIVQVVDPGEFYQQHAKIPRVTKKGARVHCFHPDHVDPEPSMTINGDGSFKCFGCGCRGSSIVQAYEYIEQVDFKTALRELATQYLGENYVPDKRVELWHRSLLSDRSGALAYLQNARGATTDVITRYKLGWNGAQFTIPIADEAGLWANVRKYNPKAKTGRKVVSFRKGYGKARIHPLETLNRKKVYLVEGEPDWICGVSHGLPCVTSTGGASHWKEEWGPLFKNKEVVILPDEDKAGLRWAEEVAQALDGIADVVKIVRLPIDEGQDLTDYLMGSGSVSDLEDLEKKVTPYVDNTTPSKRLESEAVQISLADASGAELYYRTTDIDCIVSGKELAPYLAPVKVKVDCTGGMDFCEECHRKAKGFTDTLEFNLESEDVLKLVDVPDSAIEKHIRKEGRIPPKCPLTLHHLEKANVERITLSPGVEEQGVQDIAATGYFLGHRIETNRPYRVRGFLLPEPRRQRAVHIVTRADSVFDALDSFEPSADELRGLRKFQCRNIEKWLSRYYSVELPKVTGIEGRADMHQAIDLVYHSVLSFEFNNEVIRRGWLETLIFGDTQQGKTNAAYNLARHYRLGDIATGEASTFPGLVGGLQKINDRWAVSWGLLARHDRRLIFIDEVSGLSVPDIERMSRVRSEGKAELVKIVSQTANARCRLVWLGNPRTGDHLGSYTSGIAAIKELIGKNEDISRFDFIITLVRGEVDDSVLNKKRPKNPRLKYSSDEERNLILWAWSRKPEDITFTPNAERVILHKYAQELSRDYSSEFPLVQKENIRVKIARTAAAVATRVFRSPDGKKLVVDEECVKAAVKFLRETYDKPSLGYRLFTEQMERAHTLRSSDSVVKELKSYDTYEEILEGLIEQDEVTVSDIADFAGIEKWEAKELIGKLVRQRALTKKGGGYRKKPAFISLINDLRARRLRSTSQNGTRGQLGSERSRGSSRPRNSSGR